MPFTRRQFLGTLAAAIGLAATPGIARAMKPAPQAPKANSNGVLTQKYNEDLLIDSFFPTLAQNEGERLHFYRCARKKVTIGYGTNVQDNPSALTGVSVLHKGQVLTPAQLKSFLDSMKDLTKAQLKKYTVSKTDAKKMAVTGMRTQIQELARRLTDDKTKKSIFFGLPLCMQALCLDISYNIGIEKFIGT